MSSQLPDGCDDVAGGAVALSAPPFRKAQFTDTKGYFVSESSVYRLLKAHVLITSPAFIVINAADAFMDNTTAPNQLWQTDFTYLKVIGWGWFYLTVLDDFLSLETLKGRMNRCSMKHALIHEGEYRLSVQFSPTKREGRPIESSTP